MPLCPGFVFGVEDPLIFHGSVCRSAAQNHDPDLRAWHRLGCLSGDGRRCRSGTSQLVFDVCIAQCRTRRMLRCHERSFDKLAKYIDQAKEDSEADYSFSSIRKALASPDGGLIKTKSKDLLPVEKSLSLSFILSKKLPSIAVKMT